MAVTGALVSWLIEEARPGYFPVCVNDTPVHFIPSWVWVDKTLHKDGSASYGVYERAGQGMQRSCVIPVALSKLKLSDASIVTAAAQIINVDDHSFGLVCHLIEGNYATLRNLPLCVDNQDWRRRYYNFADRVDKAVRLLQRVTRNRLGLFRLRRTFARSCLQSTPLLADCLKDTVLAYLG